MRSLLRYRGSSLGCVMAQHPPSAASVPHSLELKGQKITCSQQVLWWHFREDQNKDDTANHGLRDFSELLQ